MMKKYFRRNNWGCLNGSGSAPNLCMGFWGSNSDKPSRELPTELQGYQYDYLLKYMESRIGVIRLDDPELQGKLSKLVNDEKTSSLDSYSRHNMPTVYQDSRSGGWSTRPLELEVKHVDNDTYLRGSTKEDIQAVRSGLKSLGFYWDKQQRSWLLKNRKISVDEIKDLLRIRYSEGETAGLKAYCEKIAYRQTMDGIPNTFSAPGMVEEDEEAPLDTVPDIMDSKSSGGPYSKVEQLEKLIYLRKKGEITTEEFDSLKKELLS